MQRLSVNLLVPRLFERVRDQLQRSVQHAIEPQPRVLPAADHNDTQRALHAMLDRCVAKDSSIIASRDAPVSVVALALASWTCMAGWGRQPLRCTSRFSPRVAHMLCRLLPAQCPSWSAQARVRLWT
jgi:hypothetical protein